MNYQEFVLTLLTLGFNERYMGGDYKHHKRFIKDDLSIRLTLVDGELKRGVVYNIPNNEPLTIWNSSYREIIEFVITHNQ